MEKLKSKALKDIMSLILNEHLLSPMEEEKDDNEGMLEEMLSEKPMEMEDEYMDNNEMEEEKDDDKKGMIMSISRLGIQAKPKMKEKIMDAIKEGGKNKRKRSARRNKK